MEIEYDIGITIFAWYCVSPKFLHEENLVCELRGWAISCRSGFFDPISQVSDKIKEEISFWNGYDFVSNFHKKTETFSWSQIESLSNTCAEIFSSCRGINFEGLIGIIGKVDFVENLCCFMLDGFNFNLENND